MIFVSVGTHEQPFNRLLEYMDDLRKKEIIKETVIMQTGFSTYEPKYCEWRKLFPYKEMVKNIEDARIIITHGGPSSFIMPLQISKIPIVVPRQKKFDEHVNNHQMDFCNLIASKGNIIVIDSISELKNTILNYEVIVKSMPATLKSNNERFNIEFEKIAVRLCEKKKEK